MISVIMPTMWKPDHYKVMLPLLNMHSLVSEIIIIDNNTKKTDTDILKLEKVVHVPQNNNIYVNPAWNLGAKLARCDKLCFYSDDCLINPSSVDAVYDKIIEQNGLIGYHPSSVVSGEDFDILNFPLLEINYENIIEPINQITFTFAVCFYAHKKSYTQIPENLKIFWGDNYLFGSAAANKKQNFAILDALLLTTMHTTSHSSEFDEIVKNDHKQMKP